MPKTNQPNIRLPDLSALEHLKDAFAVLDDDWCFQYVNHAAENVIGVKAHALQDNTLWAIFRK